MGIDTVREYLKQFHAQDRILEFDQSSATADMAAEVLHTQPARIAKTLAFYREDGGCNLIVTCGDSKVDNKKYRALFHIKARLLSPEDVTAMTGFIIGGVCPFGISNPRVSIYLDESIQRFDTIFPACGSSNSAIEVTPDELLVYSRAVGFIDVCRGWRDEISFALSHQLSDLPEAKEIRRRVFMEEQGFQNEFDDIDARALHIIAYCDGRAAGTARMYPKDETAYIIGRVAVLPDFRGKHIGAALVTKLEEEAGKIGVKQIELSAQTRVIPFYESLGYQPIGEEYLDEFCPHRLLKKPL